MTKRNVKYQGISLPVPIIKQIQDHLEIHKEYTSVTNFIRKAIDTQMDRDYKLKNRIKDYFTSKEEVDRHIEERLKEYKLIKSD